MNARKHWSYDDEVIVCELYSRLHDNEMHSRNPRVIEVASLLDRSVDTVCMKLQNFVFLDPDQSARGRRGLANASRADHEVWNEFQSDREQMVQSGKSKLQELRNRRSKHATA